MVENAATGASNVSSRAGCSKVGATGLELEEVDSEFASFGGSQDDLVMLAGQNFPRCRCAVIELRNNLFAYIGMPGFVGSSTVQDRQNIGGGMRHRYRDR